MASDYGSWHERDKVKSLLRKAGCVSLVIVVVGAWLLYLASDMIWHSFAPPYDLSDTRWKDGDNIFYFHSGKDFTFKAGGYESKGVWHQEGNVVYIGVKDFNFYIKRGKQISNPKAYHKVYYLNGGRLEEKVTSIIPFFYEYEKIATKDSP